MGGLRLWGYVHNSITWIDPLGLAKGDCADKAFDPKRLPQDVQDSTHDNLSHMNKGTMPEGVANNKNSREKWGSKFKNKDGILPTKTANKAPITYKEYDIVDPKLPVSERGAYRIVEGSDGSRYFTGDHYDSFHKMK